MTPINRDWIARLHAPRYIWSQIAAHAPTRGILCREEKSLQTLLAWDVTTGETRPLTEAVPYPLNATLSPDGEFVTYLRPHPNHPEVFQYVRVPYTGGDAQPIAPTALIYASPHIEEAAGERIGFTGVTDKAYIAQVWTPTSPKPLFSFESEVFAHGPFLSADGRLAVVVTMHSADSESTHLEAYDIETGTKISQLEIADTPLEAVKFAPDTDDSRLLVQAREGLQTRPLVWDVASGEVNLLESENTEALYKANSYTAWDWLNKHKILLSDKENGGVFFTIYDTSSEKITFNRFEKGNNILVYSSRSNIIFHNESPYDLPTIGFISIEDNASIALPSQIDRISPVVFFLHPPKIFLLKQINVGALPRVVKVSFDDDFSFYSEAAAWVMQTSVCFIVNIRTTTEFSLVNHAIQQLEQAKNPPPFNQITLLTAHTLAAALALLALHHDPTLWAGGVMVRPILDWTHVYESVSPPQKAIMRLWFGGAPQDNPAAWQAASPLRQTKPLTVPVKLLYHPYETLTPIQHIQTYAANNPTVELIDISRDMVGAAHEQQERLIMRMLEAGLPLLQAGTSAPDSTL